MRTAVKMKKITGHVVRHRQKAGIDLLPHTTLVSQIFCSQIIVNTEKPKGTLPTDKISIIGSR